LGILIRTLAAERFISLNGKLECVKSSLAVIDSFRDRGTELEQKLHK